MAVLPSQPSDGPPERLLGVAGKSRRRLLIGAAAAPIVLATASALASSRVHARQSTNARILIVGAGLGGIAIANRLVRALEGAAITLLDRKEEHHYQPGYTLVATGIWPLHRVIDRNVNLIPEEVTWVRERAASFDPDRNAVITDTGRRIDYDFLVVATGCHLDFARIEGMDVAAIGTSGLTSVYSEDPRTLEATWRAMDAFRRRGGKAVMTLPGTPIKCAGAPLKMAFMLADRMKDAGTFEQSEVVFHSGQPFLFSVPVINDLITARWQEFGFGIHTDSRLVAIDILPRRATFENAEGVRSIEDYDFIHVAPPMRAPDSVFHSPLAVQQGAMAAGGWLEVNRETLRHVRYPNVFGIGDINGTARGKTAATVKASAPIVTRNLLDAIAGREPSAPQFNGYTSCPLITREGSALLLEFDYEGRLIPSLPMVDPLQDSWMAWLMKVQLLKPAYMAVARGRV